MNYGPVSSLNHATVPRAFRFHQRERRMLSGETRLIKWKIDAGWLLETKLVFKRRANSSGGPCCSTATVSSLLSVNYWLLF